MIASELLYRTTKSTAKNMPYTSGERIETHADIEGSYHDRGKINEPRIDLAYSGTP